MKSINLILHVLSKLLLCGSQIWSLLCAQQTSGRCKSCVPMGFFYVLQIKDNFGALNVVPMLTPEVLEKIEEAVGTKPDAFAVYR